MLHISLILWDVMEGTIAMTLELLQSYNRQNDPLKDILLRLNKTTF